MTKLLRRKMAGELADRYKDVRNFVLLDYRGLTAERAVALRADLRRQNVRLNIVKNSAARHALARAGLEPLGGKLKEMNGLVYGADPVVIAKAVLEFSKRNNNVPAVRGGLVNGSPVDAQQVERISQIPGQEQLLAAFLATMNAPAGAFVRLLSEIPARFVRALDAVREQKGKAG